MNRRVALLAVSELMMQSRLRESLQSLGFETVIVDSPQAIGGGLRRSPDLLVLDLQSVAEPGVWIAQAKGLTVPVLAYGQHTKANVLREARDAGATLVVTRSQLVEEFTILLGRVVQGDTRKAKSAAFRP